MSAADTLLPTKREYSPEYPENIERKRAWRSLLMKAQEGWCPICGCKLRSGGKLNLDHPVPRCRGGPDRLGNVLLTHVSCNHEKGDDIPTGCELIWLLAVNCRLGVQPQRW